MIKKLMTSKKGSSSILVVLLLIVLVVFGIAALTTTALSNLRLGQKVADWNAEYYTAEGIAWERVAEIDKAIAQAYEQPDADIAGSVADNISATRFRHDAQQQRRYDRDLF